MNISKKQGKIFTVSLFLWALFFVFWGTCSVTYAATPASCTSSSGQAGTCKKPCDAGETTTGNCTAAHGSMYANKDYSCCVPMGADYAVPVNMVSTMDPVVPGSTESGGIVQCGRGGQYMCTLCDLIKGFNIIIHYLLKIAIGIALASITIAGAIYAISTGNPGMTDTAKDVIKNVGKGLVVMLAAWIMINTLLFVIGAKSNLGITGVTAWGDFECAAVSHQ